MLRSEFERLSSVVNNFAAQLMFGDTKDSQTNDWRVSAESFRIVAANATNLHPDVLSITEMLQQARYEVDAGFDSFLEYDQMGMAYGIKIYQFIGGHSTDYLFIQLDGKSVRLSVPKTEDDEIAKFLSDEYPAEMIVHLLSAKLYPSD